MKTDMLGIEFDPGFAPYILTFAPTIDYLYMDINKFKNFSQKKVKFMQYHKKMLQILENNIGFYVGCLMWAAYIKTEPKQKILSNPCFEQEYKEEENTSETQYMLKFLELFPKDMKYFLGQNFLFNENYARLVEIYEEFLTMNEGFVRAEFNTDIQLPICVKTTNATTFKIEIQKILETKDLSKLIEFIPTII